MTQAKNLTREQEIELAYSQRAEQEKKDREAVWEKVEAEQNRGKM